jgi:hypothetical protein
VTSSRIKKYKLKNGWHSVKAPLYLGEVLQEQCAIAEEGERVTFIKDWSEFARKSEMVVDGLSLPHGPWLRRPGCIGMAPPSRASWAAKGTVKAIGK